MIASFQAALHKLARAVAVVRISDWTIVYANERCERMHAASVGPGGLVGQPLTASQAMSSGSGDFPRVIQEQLARGQPEAVFESESKRANGELICIQITVTPYADAEHGTLWVAVIEDITAMRAATAEVDEINSQLAEALSGSERSFQRIVASGMFGMLRAKLPPSPDAGVMAANDAFARMIGWTHEEIAAGALRAPAPFLTPEGRKVALQTMEEVRAKGHSALLETEFMRKDGSRFPVLVGAAAMSDDELVTIVLDRSDYQAKEAALRASQARFDAISNAGLIGVAVASIGGEVIDVNDACARMFGYSRAEYLAQRISFDQLTPDTWTGVTVDARRQLREQGFTALYRKRLLHRSGGTLPVLIAAVSLGNDQVMGLLIDLSEQERTEQALRDTEEQLRQAQKMEAIGRLAGGVAHDFNNILSVILSYADIIREDHPPGAPLRADADEIHSAAVRAANLTKQLLLFTRQQVAETRVFDLNEALASLRKMLERLVGEDVEIVSLAGTALGKVRADPAHLEQVVLNLVVNARDAMPSGGKLTLETANAISPGAGSVVLLKVTDTGCGMDAATRARIFEPFFTTKSKDKGTGLGLSTVFGIVQQAGGTISVESELGLGSTFTIALPRADAECELEPPSEPKQAARAGHETILLVEDEAPVRRVARSILEGAGYRVIEASNAIEALELFEKHADIELVLTDVVMPKMNGIELIRRIRTSPRPGLPRVLCMSGYTDDETTRHGLKELKVPFLQKPFTPESLRRKVREVLEAATGREVQLN